jgi:peptidoglycan/LPS O-acetylase OafA/YrhL
MLNGKQMIPTHSTTLESTPLLPADPHISGPRAQGLASRLLLSFSVLASAKRILNVNPTTSLSTDDGTLHAIHGIRFLSMSWVILGHTWLYIGGKTSNILDVINFVKRFTFQAIVNATVSVDTFFLLSGTLLSYLLLREIKRCNGPSNISWFKFIVHRYLRLSPIYMILAVLLLVLYRYMGSGPFWYTGGYDCEKYWWTYLLYINNIVDLEHMCNGYTWYMANDMQFFLISLGLIALLYKRAVLGVISVLLVATASSVTTGVITYVKNYPAALPGLAAQSNVDSRAWYNDVYWVPWCRIGPYLVGVLLGYLLFRFKCKVRMHWVVVICGWCLAAACNLGVLYGLYDEANGHNASQTVNSLYAATHRTLWAVGVAWVIFACVTGYGGIVNILLSWPGFVPLSRLTYAAYLVQTPLILWVYGNAKSLYHITEISMTILFCGHLVLSYGIAFVVSMAFETPVIGIMKLVLSHRK